ncbi:type IX secretion system membrane protein, PorP/SprF family [Nonlabens sp. Hel1_33_55]|uniref:PorP/SprF family type IX secretion system membrane protein n=1 Tax=Nonlabens sp. Hel1_33_55 TaxID=1336802 RepID=UPI000875ADD0|nr:type IX secretion system membrane protein PorP/SprF [Nonlabens sp. Hel1_33_55]SCY07202.1 type IX secretion system membrane protein, PorP/SprF family [Nonlabens sp. Hel1_33_55]
MKSRLIEVAHRCLENRNYVLMLMFLAFAKSGIAQQEPQYTQYMYNPSIINPAYSGSTGTLDLFAAYRNQWTGLDGAPETQTLGVNKPLYNERMGIGLNIQNETLGPVKEFNAVVNFSYNIDLNYNTKLAFGVSGGIDNYDVDFSRGTFQDGNDPILSNNIDNRFSAIIGAGAYVYSDSWYAGVSVPDFFTNELYNGVENSIATEELQLYLMGGYVFELNPNLKFKPTVLAKYQKEYPLVVDISANFLIQDVINVGASYRYDDAVSALAGIHIFDGFFAGYSYDYTVTGLSSYNDGSHEIVLRYTLPQRSEKVNSPRFF